MLVLSRCAGESIVCTTQSGERIIFQVVEFRDGKFKKARIGIEADRSVTIDRLEVDAAKRMGLSEEQAKSLRLDRGKDGE